ncbi:hypothetical protein [Actinomadura sp. 9N215]|uniref:hypothetical protein n=1 Tax=Actinomadura sp. 9N215 TaxID=3375150 RepID=UPI0037BBF65B
MGVPVLVRTRGETGRLLGSQVADVEPPVWWVECNAAEDVDGSEVPAMRFAGALVAQVGGVVWVDDPAYVERSGVGG